MNSSRCPNICIIPLIATERLQFPTMMQSIIAYDNSNTTMQSGEVMTNVASVPHHHHQKASHQHHHHDEEITAYSSWHDEEDGNSQLSSCLSSVDLHHDDHVACIGEADEKFHRGSVILLSSSECSLLDKNDADEDDYHTNTHDNSSPSLTGGKGSVNMEEQEMNNRMTAFQELSERASHLLQRERSPEYAVDDYFQRSYYDETADRYCDNDNDIHKSPTDESISKIDYLTPSTSDKRATSRNSTPIDMSCRSKMMEWSYRVIEFSFPPPASQQQENQQSPLSSSRQGRSSKASTRQHSTEALQLICTTFSYIDRLCTKFKVVDREEYKLLSMVCLNLAAKSSGLFGADGEREWYEFFIHQCSDACCKNEHCSKHNDNAITASLSSSSCDNIDSSSSKDSACTGQTILSTPEKDNVGSLRQPQRPRPPMDLISLPGLYTLCNGLFTKEQFCEMEYNILHRGLGWRLNSVQVIDWVDLCLELSMLLQLDGSRCLPKEDYSDIRETVMVQLEYAVEDTSFLRCAPSHLAVAAFLNAAEGYSDSGECILDCIEEVFGLSLDESEMDNVRYMMRSQMDEPDYT
eukprot:scaffold14450_cov244-Skeletonema_marinoi.AAC.2